MAGVATNAGAPITTSKLSLFSTSGTPYPCIRLCCPCLPSHGGSRFSFCIAKLEATRERTPRQSQGLWKYRRIQRLAPLPSLTHEVEFHFCYVRFGAIICFLRKTEKAFFSWHMDAGWQHVVVHFRSKSYGRLEKSGERSPRRY